MKILIFTEGTIIIHRDKQLIHDYGSYVPIGNATDKLNNWRNQGIKIIYLTSRTMKKEINDVKNVLDKYNFPEGQLLFRKKKEKYKDIAEKVKPDILIEDDCKSIGGSNNMTITFINPKIKEKIKSIVVQEFKGIDHLPDDVNELVRNV